MNVTTVDDKKEKYQSWAASSEATFSESMLDADVDLTAFGATEIEAKANLLMAANKVKHALDMLIKDLTLELPCEVLDELVVKHGN